MTENDKMVLKAQLSNVQAQLSIARGAAAQPIITQPQGGVAVAPGMAQLAQSFAAAVEQLTKVLEKVIEKS